MRSGGTLEISSYYLHQSMRSSAYLLVWGDDIEGYKNMVQFINATEIAPDEKLSDDVYIYDSEGLHKG